MKLWGVKWYWWLALIVAPGGFAFFAMAKARARNTAKDLGNNPASTSADARAANVDANARSLIDSAKAAASALSAGLKDNPLAASLLGVSPSLIAAGSPSDVAAASAKNESIRSQIVALESQLAQYQAGYARDHNGGQSPSQESAIENSIVSQIQALQAQLTA